jgi:hypothetical protein
LRLEEFSKDKVTTVRGSQRRTVIHVPVHRYPIPLQLRYKARSKQGPVQGFGQTRLLSSKEIIFAAGEGLEPGMTAEVALSWPFLLGGRVRLQLVLGVRIISSEDGMAEARILAYDFRTAGPARR